MTLLIAGLNPNTHPIQESSCGCKFLDGVVVGMCDKHWDEMQKGFGSEEE